MRKTKIIWLVIFIFGFLIRGTEVFHSIDTESWRESDESSIARNYFRNGMDFSHPQIDWGGTGPGYTESEFPVYPYLIALSYKIFGLWEPAGRVISLIFSLMTLLVFFRFSKYLFEKRTAVVVASFFALSPLLAITSVTIQPESVMFFFYVSSAYCFTVWIENQSVKYFVLAALATALTILCKVPSVNIGLLFLILIVIKKGWNFLIKPKVLLFGILSIVPPVIWYFYTHEFYLEYGNSLGISNEYAWIGWDFFTKKYYIMGIIKNQVKYIWTYSGVLLVIWAFLSRSINRKLIILPLIWFGATILFYVVASKTASDEWAFYYHIFSVPSVSMLLGISFMALYDKYLPNRQKDNSVPLNHSSQKEIRVLGYITFVIAGIFLALSLSTIYYKKKNVITRSKYYDYKDDLAGRIPGKSIILASGGWRGTDERPFAYNSSYFFYWLDLKGYNISIEDQSMNKVLEYKNKGASYFIAETWALELRPGFSEELRKSLKVEFESDEIILFKL